MTVAVRVLETHRLLALRPCIVLVHSGRERTSAFAPYSHRCLMNSRRHIARPRVLGSALALVATATGLGLSASPVGGSSASPSSHATASRVVPLLRFDPAVHFATVPNTNLCDQRFGYSCYNPRQIETAYDMRPLFASGDTGKGETIVLVDSFGSPTIRADLRTFDKAFGFPNPQLTIVQPAGKVPAWNPKNSTMVNWGGETSLDVEYSHAMAPAAKIVLVETPVAETEGIAGLPQMMASERVVMDPTSKYYENPSVISQSFGATESTFATAMQIIDLAQTYQIADTDDVTVLAAAGDDGSTEPINDAGTEYATTREIRLACERPTRHCSRWYSAPLEPGRPTYSTSRQRLERHELPGRPGCGRGWSFGYLQPTDLPRRHQGRRWGTQGHP